MSKQQDLLIMLYDGCDEKGQVKIINVALEEYLTAENGKKTEKATRKKVKNKSIKRQGPGKKLPIIYKDKEYKSLTAFCNDYGIAVTTVSNLYKRGKGLPLEEIVARFSKKKRAPERRKVKS
jgi:hypothetical protein